ncbi:MAG: hypothetical protein M3P12_12320 [Gemmatimonadota bacterium]|nr:hypothetical protein [Gemmatimonadota bacterium]
MDSRSVDAALREITVHYYRTALTQHHVGLVRAVVIGIAFDANADRRILLRCLYLLIQQSDSLFADL